jgi:hypothetical protein
VTRGTRPKKPSSSRGFAARKARGSWGSLGSWGSWGLKTDFFFSLFKPATTTKKNLFIYFILFSSVRIRANAPQRPRTLKTRPRGKCGRERKSGRRPRTSGREGRPNGNFHPKTSVMTTLQSTNFWSKGILRVNYIMYFDTCS